MCCLKWHLQQCFVNNLYWSALELVFLNVFINDLGSGAISDKSADATKRFRVVTTKTDSEMLQKDISRFRWRSKQMANVIQLHWIVMLMGWVVESWFHTHTDGVWIVNDEPRKILGTWGTTQRKCVSHVQQLWRRHSMVGVIRNMIESKTANIVMSTHKPITWPHLEYCVQFWWPHLKKDIVELLQRATKTSEGWRLEATMFGAL